MMTTTRAFTVLREQIAMTPSPSTGRGPCQAIVYLLGRPPERCGLPEGHVAHQDGYGRHPFSPSEGVSTSVPDERFRSDAGVWEVQPNVSCVACPSCAFTFAAEHTDPDGGYSCPNCGDNVDLAGLSERAITDLCEIVGAAEGDGIGDPT